MNLFEELQVGADKSTLRLTHTKEPVFIEHREGDKIAGYSWHPVQKRLHPQLATSYEFGVRHVEGTWPTVQEARDEANKLYERAALANFTDKIPHIVSSEIKQTEAGEQYQEVHFIDPDIKEPITTHYQRVGGEHGASVKYHDVHDEYTASFDPAKVKECRDAHCQVAYPAYETAKALHALSATKPFAFKIQANDTHAMYKTAKSPEEASALHEKTLLVKHKDAIIKRHSPTAFELHRRKGSGVIHSFAVPGQLHEVDGGPMNVAEGSLTAPAAN
jgi:hypothetical protein